MTNSRFIKVCWRPALHPKGLGHLTERRKEREGKAVGGRKELEGGWKEREEEKLWAGGMICGLLEEEGEEGE